MPKKLSMQLSVCIWKSEPSRPRPFNLPRSQGLALWTTLLSKLARFFETQYSSVLYTHKFCVYTDFLYPSIACSWGIMFSHRTSRWCLSVCPWQHFLALYASRCGHRPATKAVYRPDAVHASESIPVPTLICQPAGCVGKSIIQVMLWGHHVTAGSHYLSSYFLQ